jgi:hypothetical protein
MQLSCANTGFDRVKHSGYLCRPAICPNVTETVYFARRVYLWVSYDFQNMQRLFP